ncbi:hypothetical protein BU15DRAFT_68759 [Melanogaster broomeanus]|nr:hypothetical protein BU15DRAFT_68759 [Melanogaster broomeanus]
MVQSTACHPSNVMYTFKKTMEKQIVLEFKASLRAYLSAKLQCKRKEDTTFGSPLGNCFVMQKFDVWKTEAVGGRACTPITVKTKRPASKDVASLEKNMTRYYVLSGTGSYALALHFDPWQLDLEPGWMKPPVQRLDALHGTRYHAHEHSDIHSPKAHHQASQASTSESVEQGEECVSEWKTARPSDTCMSQMQIGERSILRRPHYNR